MSDWFRKHELVALVITAYMAGVIAVQDGWWWVGSFALMFWIGGRLASRRLHV